MIQVVNNILFYLNLAALLQSQHESSNSSSTFNGTISSGLIQPEQENLTAVLPHILVKQIPPGPIIPGAVVKFVCAVEDIINRTNDGGGCINASETDNTVYSSDGYSYQWEMLQYVEDKSGNVSSTSVVKLPGQDSEMEMKFNETVANPKINCDLVCTITSNPKMSSAAIKLYFRDKEIQKIELSPPSNFKMLAITARAVYFSWNPFRIPRNMSEEGTSGTALTLPEITGFIIEYKNGKGAQNWRNGIISQYEIKRGDAVAACITNLRPSTTYYFRIISCSRNVSSSPSSPVIVRTDEDLPSASPTEIKVEAVEENLLQISWQPPPRSSWNGALLGYNIGLKKASSSEDEPYEIHILGQLETLGNMYFYRIAVSDATTPYQIVVQAFNNVGAGPFSQPVIQKQQQVNQGEG